MALEVAVADDELPLLEKQKETGTLQRLIHMKFKILIHTMNTKSSYILSLRFAKDFFADFRTRSITGSYTSFERIICVLILMSYAHPFHRSQQFRFQHFCKLLFSVEFCSHISS